VLQVAASALALVIAVTTGAWGSNHIDHGPTGTANHDYFDPNPDTQRLRKNVEFHHLGQPFWVRYRAGEYDKALAELDYTLVRFPNHPRALALLGSVARLMKRTALPLRYFERALSLYPQYAVTHAQYGMYLVEIGQVEPGVAHLNGALEREPDSALAHAGLAIAYQKSGNSVLAHEFLQKARKFGYTGKIE
jgi:Tfp pilus assembly protein PilF